MRAGFTQILVVALALVAPSAASAQRSQPSRQPPPRPPYVVPPGPQPSAPAALTVPNPFGPPAGTIDLYHRPDNFHSPTPPQPPFFGGGGYVPGYADPYPASPYAPGAYVPLMMVDSARMGAMSGVAKGGLRLETVPGSAQVFVDGYYVGIVDDYGTRGSRLELPVGSHHIELRAPGYAVLSFDVNIAANQVARYSGDLQRVTPAATTIAANVSSVPRKFYVIPNCYAGDRPPTLALPKGCTLQQMRVVDR